MQKYYSNTSLPVVSSDGKLNKPTSTSTKPTSKSTNPNPTLTETSEKQEKGKIKPLQKRNRDEDVSINMPKNPLLQKSDLEVYLRNQKQT